MHPTSINTDKNPAYSRAIKKLKEEGKGHSVKHNQVKYLNNIIESDHGKLKRLIKTTLGFKSMKTAYATIKGFEIMRIFKKGKFEIWKYARVSQIESLQDLMTRVSYCYCSNKYHENALEH